MGTAASPRSLDTRLARRPPRSTRFSSHCCGALPHPSSSSQLSLFSRSDLSSILPLPWRWTSRRKGRVPCPPPGYAWPLSLPLAGRWCSTKKPWTRCVPCSPPASMSGEGRRPACVSCPYRPDSHRGPVLHQRPLGWPSSSFLLLQRSACPLLDRHAAP